MPEKIDNLLVWGRDNIEDGTIEQAARTSRLPFIAGSVCLMPDAHVGMGSTVGSVIPTYGAIIPAAIGVDIGCGMIATDTGLESYWLPDDLGPLLSMIESVVPAGMGRGHDRRRYMDHTMPDVGELIGWPSGTDLSDRQRTKATEQFGSLGGGNHFVEVCLDERSIIWLVLHSGSRGIGKELAERHIDKAKGIMKRYFVELEDPDLAYLAERTPEFDEYIADMLWAQDWALGNRQAMMNASLAVFADALALPEADRLKPMTTIQSHHNFTTRENHHGRNLWITRKGAVKAAAGDLGILPGSMATGTYIVRGLGNPASFNSCAHGAGRRMSRMAARRNLTVESLNKAMAGKSWLSNKGDELLDEHPLAYKDVESVQRAQEDLVEVVHTLHQVLNYKGTGDGHGRGRR